ncbi:MAG TPA: tetratricopeptide repeat protein [Gemmataceae bacterium]|nr:tetratricopeptide repeat protein [Gemmataceae bacterium]
MSERLRFLLWLGVVAVVATLAAGGAARWRRGTLPEARFRGGQDALHRGDRDEAERIAQVLLADGQADWAYTLRGDILFQQKQYDRAIVELSRVKGSGEVRVESALILGQCLLLQGEYGQAERALLYVVGLRPNNADARRCLAWIYHDQGAEMRAVEQAQEWGRLEARNGRPFWMMGEIHQNLEHLSEAVECYQEALRRELPADIAANVRQQLAECLVKQLHWSDALDALDAAPTLPETEERQALRVESLWGLGRAEPARALLDAGLVTYPRGAELLRIGAEIRQADKHPDEAAALLVRALEVDRHDYVSRHKLAQVYESLGRSADAAEQRKLADQTKGLIEEMTRLRDEAANNVWDAAPRLRLAKICEELGQEKPARMWREAAKACGLGASK